MAFQYTNSADGEAFIAVKDYELATNFLPKIGDVVVISGGKISEPTIASKLVTSTTNLGVCEGTNFEGLGVTPKVGKVRLHSNAVYEAPYGSVNASGVFTKASLTDAQWKALIGTTAAIGLNDANDASINTVPLPAGASYARGYIVDSVGTVKLVKITSVDIAKGTVHFQFVPTAVYTS